jgi:parvulin-like peptidyl-prolyl isomerase
MRLFLCVLGLTAGLFAQTPIAAPAPPAATGEPPKSGDTIVVINGKAWTRQEWDQFVDGLPENTLSTYKTNPTEFVRQLAILDHLTAKAEREKFLEKDPYLMRYWLERRKLVATFYQEHTQNMTIATDEEVRAYFDKSQDRFTTVTLKMIYLSPPAAATDGTVRTKADGIYAELMKGADFVRLVREHSEEPGSKARDGDLGTLSKSDALPDEVKAVVFAMKKGDISKPIAVTNGVYIFRCEEAKTEKFEDVKETLRTEVRQRKYIEWFDGERKKADVKFVRQDYLSK